MKSFFSVFVIMALGMLIFSSCEATESILQEEDLTPVAAETITAQSIFEDLEPLGLRYIGPKSNSLGAVGSQNFKPALEEAYFSIVGSNDQAIIRKVSETEYESYRLKEGNVSLVATISEMDGRLSVISNKHNLSYGIDTEGNLKANDELGPRRVNEDFGDCFSRNWTNFCDDFVSCAAQVVNPWAVGAAISISCA